MSTAYRLLDPILVSDLLDGRLEKFDIREICTDDTTEKERVLTDGRSYLWIYIDDAGFVTDLPRYLPNWPPGKILSAIAEACDTKIVSEYEPQFWGFDTEEERDAWEREIHEESEREFRNDILKFIRGEPCDIKPGTIGMLKAEFAKKLVENDPTLLATENNDKLWAEIGSV